MREVWKQSFVEGYEVSNRGRVRNKRTKKIRWLETKESGYLRLTIWVKKVIKHIRVNRMVAVAFIPNPDNKPEVDHIDHDRTNNNVENLRWVTHKENLQNRRRRNANT